MQSQIRGGRKGYAGARLAVICGVSFLLCVKGSAYEGKYPPPPAGMEFEEIEENPYFVQDENDPRILHPAPGFEERGIDRGYIEKMARPPIPTEVFDALDAVRVKEVQPFVRPDPTQQKAVVLDGNILVVEGDEGVTVNMPSGITFAHGGVGLQVTINRVWGLLGDEFDFITVFSTYSDPSIAAYYLPLQQDTTGLGQCNFNAGHTFGCIFNQAGVGARLQGFIFMNSIQVWRNWDYNYDGQYHPLDSFDASVFSGLGQETAHRWAAGLRFKHPQTGAVSSELLGRDSSHWAAYADTKASVLDGWEWRADEDGSFTLINDMHGFWTLDLYAMGALAANDTEPFFYIDDARFIANAFVNNQWIPANAVLQVPSVALMAANDVTLRATGERVDLTIGDISSAEGVRCPDPDHAPDAYRQLFVLVTRPGETASQVTTELQQLELIRGVWEEWWLDRTRRTITLCTEPNQNCIHPWAILGEGNVEVDESEIVPGASFSFEMKAYVYDTDLLNAHMDFTVEGEFTNHVTLTNESVSLDTILAEDVERAETTITIDAEYSCGAELNLRSSLRSSNAETIESVHRLYPGYEALFHADFDEDDSLFSVTGDPETGAFERVLLETSCEMTHRSPSRDDSPGGLGAFVTGRNSELDGISILNSSAISVDGHEGSLLRFSYWLRGRGDLKVWVSEDEENWEEAAVLETVSDFDQWETMAVDLDVTLGATPEQVAIRFEASGEGRFEAAVDEVMVLSPIGVCSPLIREEEDGLFSCSCRHSSQHDTKETYGAWALWGLIWGLRKRREA